MRKLSTSEAAQYLADLGLPISPRTLDNWAWSGRGPAYHKAMTGRRVYDQATLDAFAAQAFGPLRKSTSDRHAATVEG